jgi:hypothetical protein
MKVSEKEVKGLAIGQIVISLFNTGAGLGLKIDADTPLDKKDLAALFTQIAKDMGE